MQTIKKGLSLLLALFIAFSCCGFSAFASQTLRYTSTDLSSGVVIKFDYESSFRYFEKQILSYNKDNLAELDDIISGIEDVLMCTVQLNIGEKKSEMCRAEWNRAELDYNVTGTYTLIATLIPPEGYTIAENVRSQIKLTIQILDELAPVQLVSIKNWEPYSLAIAVNQNDTLESITDNPLFIEISNSLLQCVDEFGGIHVAEISWDFSTLDLEQVGLYTLVGTPISPKGTVFAEDLVLPQPTVNISVQVASKPDINCFYLLFPDLIMPWVAPTDQLDTVTVWLSENEGEWQELTSTAGARVEKNGISISLDQFSLKNKYQIQVDYGLGQTGILSFTWDDTIVINGYWEGDRDGSDGDGFDPPTVVQPPPNLDNDRPFPSLPPSTPTPTLSPTFPVTGELELKHEEVLPTQNSEKQNSVALPSRQLSIPFLEETNSTSTTISGLRLRLMLEEEKKIQFSKQDISVILSNEAVSTLQLTDSDKFFIEIDKPDDNTFTFHVLVNEKSVTVLTGTIVSLPYTTNNNPSSLTLQQDKTNDESEGFYDNQTGLATFVVDTTGSYSILDETNGKQPKPKDDMFFPVVLTLGSLLIVGLGIWFYKRIKK